MAGDESGCATGVPSESCSLYRFYGEGALLYVGITGGGTNRFSTHRREKEWWHRVSLIEVEHFASREDAVAAEREQIVSLRPIYNSQHSREEPPSEPWIEDAEHYRCGRCGTTFTASEIKGIFVLCRRCRRLLRKQAERAAL